MMSLNDNEKDFQKKLQEEMGKLYKEMGINPLSGCLPIIIQMPFLMELEHAASKIENAIAKNKAEYAFPFLFASFAKILSKIPRRLREKIISVANYEKHRPKRG